MPQYIRGPDFKDPVTSTLNEFGSEHGPSWGTRIANLFRSLIRRKVDGTKKAKAMEALLSGKSQRKRRVTTSLTLVLLGALVVSGVKYFRFTIPNISISDIVPTLGARASEDKADRPPPPTTPQLRVEDVLNDPRLVQKIDELAEKKFNARLASLPTPTPVPTPAPVIVPPKVETPPPTLPPAKAEVKTKPATPTVVPVAAKNRTEKPVAPRRTNNPTTPPTREVAVSPIVGYTEKQLRDAGLKIIDR
jgi:hypothetical protein